MNEDTGACAPCQPCDNNLNGITVKADREFGAIELAFQVQGRRIGCYLQTREAHDLSEALKGAVCEMMGDDSQGGRCCQNDNQNDNHNDYREDQDGNELLPKE